ncbi:LOW QUALITY PROTEIN: hypothetical protein PSENEW3n2_00000854 [Picochlorum sp. SENEW3]|nr:LOW QUALITY PROTEIN: hypothetical protein PSENEW3n2_00000854 [Picochlorum sp. SENEW3]WPT15776.1 LOW QUALITY PROTEIN: hypothetical protein PSENEW3_00000854 [Picochlorum sp. SENEW3]
MHVHRGGPMRADLQVFNICMRESQAFPPFPENPAGGLSVFVQQTSYMQGFMLLYLEQLKQGASTGQVIDSQPNVQNDRAYNFQNFYLLLHVEQHNFMSTIRGSYRTKLETLYRVMHGLKKRSKIYAAGVQKYSLWLVAGVQD